LQLGTVGTEESVKAVPVDSQILLDVLVVYLVGSRQVLVPGELSEPVAGDVEGIVQVVVRQTES
jgi:hypothetical protein